MDNDRVARSSRGLTSLTVVRTDRPRTAFDRQVRDALNHLYDPSYLQAHPLARLIRADQRTGAAIDGRELRRVLLDAVDALHPNAGGSASDRANRSYQILVLHYSEAMDPEQVQARLGISRAAYYRGQKRGTEALADYLWARSRLANQVGTTGDRAAPDSPERDPPADSLAVGSRPTLRIPVPLTSFIGRENEIAEVKRLVSTTRLLTLTGGGGCGKTRLVLRVAADVVAAIPDGVWVVELASLAEEGLLARSILSSLGVLEAPGRPALATLTDYLRTRSLLLVLDNCEHLIRGCAELVAELLRTCPQLRIVVTSRETLGVEGEMTWRVPSMSIPDIGGLLSRDYLIRSEAVQLFVERARSVEPTFTLTESNAAAVAQICRRLDGIPLATELAAARIRVMTAEQIAGRLDDRFTLLAGESRTALRRHQTLRATIDWSYDLASDQEQALFQRLAVFAGGWTLEAAEAVGSGNGISRDAILQLLTHLVDKSMIVVDRPGAEVRYRLLETLRQYGRERLATSGEADGVQEAHAVFFLTLAEQMMVTHWELYERVQLDRLDVEHDNLRAALQRFADRGDTERGLRLSRALGSFWCVRGYLTEGQSWLDASLGRSVCLSAELRAEALGAAGELALARGDLEVAATFARESVAIWRQLGDRRRLARALYWLGCIARDQCSYPEALAALQERLRISQVHDDQFAIAKDLYQLGMLARQQSELPRARSLLEHALAIQRTFDHPWLIGLTLFNLGLVAEDQGDYPRAQSLYQEDLAIARQMNDPWSLAFLLEAFASLAAARGDVARGAVLSGAAAALRQEIGSTVPPAMQPRVDRAVRLAREGLGEAAFAEAWAGGQTMTLEQAAAYALNDDGR